MNAQVNKNLLAVCVDLTSKSTIRETKPIYLSFIPKEITILPCHKLRYQFRESNWNQFENNEASLDRIWI